MAKLADLFGRKLNEADPADPIPSPTGERDDSEDLRRFESEHRDYESEQRSLESYADYTSPLPEDTGVLHDLLTDTSRKIGEIDDLRQAFEKIVAPFNSSLRALEQEKSQTINLTGMMNESRATYDTLRSELYNVEKTASALAAEAEKLRDELEVSRESNRALESTRLSNDIATRNAQIAELERQLAQEGTERRILSDTRRSLQEQVDSGQKRIGELEGELAAARERLAILEDEKRSLQLAVDQGLNETARLTRRLTDSENTLTATRAQLGKIEASFAEAYTERGRLAAALDEAKEQHQEERNSLNMRLDGLQSRAATAERLLSEARRNLIARTEEARAFDRKSVEATIARNNAEKRLAQMETSYETRDRQIKELEQARAALSERNNALAKALKMRDTALARAEEKIGTLTERNAHLEADVQLSRNSVEQRVEDLNNLVQNERMERAVVEGTLEAARKDNSRLQNEVASLRSTLRRGLPLEEAHLAPNEPDNDEAHASKPKKSKGGG